MQRLLRLIRPATSRRLRIKHITIVCERFGQLATDRSRHMLAVDLDRPARGHLRTGSVRSSTRRRGTIKITVAPVVRRHRLKVTLALPINKEG